MLMGLSYCEDPPVIHYIMFKTNMKEIIFLVMGTFHTGQRAPTRRTYTFVGHMQSSKCKPTENEKRIPLAAGNTFPPCMRCENAAYWVT